MEDKCFCHFNGFAVKDAKARQEIENIKTTYATKEELNNIDISDIDLTDYATKDYVDNKITEVDLTDYATKEYVDNKQGVETILFNYPGGTLEDITLSDSVNNYEYLEIYYVHGTACHYVKTLANSELVCLESNYINTVDHFCTTQIVQLSISDKTISCVHKAVVDHRTNNHVYLDTVSIKVTRIVGIK